MPNSRLVLFAKKIIRLSQGSPFVSLFPLVCAFSERLMLLLMLPGCNTNPGDLSLLLQDYIASTKCVVWLDESYGVEDL